MLTGFLASAVGAMCADRNPGGAAERRRGRRFRMFWRHEQLSLQMMRAALEHHSRQVKATVGVQTSWCGSSTPCPRTPTWGCLGRRPHCLCEPQGSLSVWQHRGSCEASCPSLHVPVLHRIDEVDLAPLLLLQEPALVQEISEVPGPFPLVRGLQPMDVEQVLDVPVLHHYDDFFNIAQLEQELSEQVIEPGTLKVHAGLPSQRQQLREVCWAGSFAPATEAYFASRQVQFLNLVAVVPVVQRHGLGPDSVKTVWRLRSCSSSMCLLCPVVPADSPQVPGFLRTSRFRLDAETCGDSIRCSFWLRSCPP